MNNSGRFIDCSPSPYSLMLSLRDIGYSLDTAIADLIDNSITAGARNIWIRYSWNAGKPWLGLIDDGAGMSSDELCAAMRFGSTNPLDLRDATDLGRFGLGLKTASLSQCRHLIVLSKKNGTLSGCEWDMSKLASEGNGKWLLGVLSEQDVHANSALEAAYEETLSAIDTGTMVFWSQLDRIDEKDTPKKQEDALNALVCAAKSHLELVFHRYLSPGSSGTKTRMFLNGSALNAFDPFNARHVSTQEMPVQKVIVDGQEIQVQPYVLPHHSKLPREEYQRFGGEEGYLHNQGFYVYRNRRLIIKGTWFNLKKKEELNKLIRIRVDIPNTLDHLWKIDVKKSRAVPPERIRRELRQIIDRIEDRGKKVYRQRGTRLAESVRMPAWNRIAKDGGITYEVNRTHPMLVQLSEELCEDHRELLQSYIATLENSFPAEIFFNDVATSPELLRPPGLRKDQFRQILENFLEFLAKNGQVTSDTVRDILSTEPFASDKVLTQQLLHERGIV